MAVHCPAFGDRSRCARKVAAGGGRSSSGRMPTSRRRRFLVATAAALALAAIVGLATILREQPRAERAWVPLHAVAPTVRIEGDLVHVSGVRDFTFDGPDDFTPAWGSRTYDLRELTGVWFVLAPFDSAWRGPAHSFVTFGFADSQFVSISVEARREQGETYDMLAGVLRRYELLYVVGEERDLIGQRAAFGEGPVYLYPVRTSPEKRRAAFVAMLRRAERLRTQPEFYNTLTNNCTSNVLAHVNEVAPNAVPGGWRTLLPGYTDEVAHELGLLETTLDIERARERFRINARARRWLDDPAFSLRIRDSSTVLAGTD